MNCIIRKSVKKGLIRRKKIIVVARYLKIYFNVKISETALVQRAYFLKLSLATWQGGFPGSVASIKFRKY